MSEDDPRPAKSEKRQRTARLFLRLTPDEAAAILARADKAGMTPPAYMRAAALGSAGPRAQRRIPVDAALLRQVLGHLGRVGNNLNQIARHLNTGRDGDMTAEMVEALADYGRIRPLIYAALGKDADPESLPGTTPPATPSSASAAFAAAARPAAKPATVKPEAPADSAARKPASRFTRPPRP